MGTKTIGKFRLCQVCSTPNIYTIDDFITPSQLEHLTDIARKQRFQKSYLDNTDPVNANDDIIYNDEQRTSTFVSFSSKHDKVIKDIELRAADLLGYFTSVETVENLQMVRNRE